jgi:2-phospho-L-lactate guanylyltransferase
MAFRLGTPRLNVSSIAEPHRPTMLAFVPVKALHAAKQRLASILPAAARAALSAAMLADVVAALTRQAAVKRVVLCSSDPIVEALAGELGVEFMPEEALGCAGLNAVVNAAARKFEQAGVKDLMVVHGDLPMLGAEELGRFVEVHTGAATPAVTLAPDARRDGTNLLAWNPATAFRTQYGPASFSSHCAQASELGIAPTICMLPGASLDIDEPDHLGKLIMTLSDAAESRTGRFLAQNGLLATGLEPAGVIQR